MTVLEQGIATVRMVQTRSTDLVEGVASVLPAPVGGLLRKGFAVPLGLFALAVDRLPQPSSTATPAAPAYPAESRAENRAENRLANRADHRADHRADKAQGDTPGASQAEEVVEVAVDEFGAVGSFTDNTGVEPDGEKAPFAGYDKLSGDRVMAHVAESTDLPDLQVLLAYEEAHKNRKGVVQAVEARLAALGSPVG
jgi:hypothetical protein